MCKLIHTLIKRKMRQEIVERHQKPAIIIKSSVSQSNQLVFRVSRIQ